MSVAALTHPLGEMCVFAAEESLRTGSRRLDLIPSIVKEDGERVVDVLFQAYELMDEDAASLVEAGETGQRREELRAGVVQFLNDLDYTGAIVWCLIKTGTPMPHSQTLGKHCSLMMLPKKYPELFRVAHTAAAQVLEEDHLEDVPGLSCFFRHWRIVAENGPAPQAA